MHTINHIRISSLLFLFVLLFAATGVKAQISVESKLDRAEILIGEQVNMQVKVTAPMNKQVLYPDLTPGAQLMNGIEIIHVDDVDTVKSDNGMMQQYLRNYVITAFDSALYYIPPFEVTVDGKTYRSPRNLGLKVNTVEVDTLHTDVFNPAHDVVDAKMEINPNTYYLFAAVFLLFAAVLYLAFRLTDRKPMLRRIVIHPAMPPHIKAISSLENLKAETLNDDKAFYVALTDALRLYIRERFEVDATEMTTNQIIEEVSLKNDAAALRELREILETADLVKFAKFNVSDTERDRNVTQAVDYVDTTKLLPKETPKPKVKYVPVTDMRQIWTRRSMLLVITLSLLALAAVAAYMTVDIFHAFL